MAEVQYVRALPALPSLAHLWGPLVPQRAAGRKEAAEIGLGSLIDSVEPLQMHAHSRFLLIGTAIMVATILCAGCSKAPETTATRPAVLPASNNVVDGDVTANVKSAFGRDEALKGFDIAVVTLNGDVRLIGVLDNQRSIDHAIAVARAAEGVHSIHDELTIRK